MFVFLVSFGFFLCKSRLCPPTHARQSNLIVDEPEGVNFMEFCLSSFPANANEQPCSQS